MPIALLPMTLDVLGISLTSLGRILLMSTMTTRMALLINIAKIIRKKILAPIPKQPTKMITRVVLNKR